MTKTFETPSNGNRATCGENNGQSDEPMVSVLCISYNAEAFVEQCLHGILSQETNFKFEVVFHDDASSDGTQTIVQEFINAYPSRIVPIFQEKNQYSMGISPLRSSIPFIRGEYVAFCEADDCWIDKTKLQRQLDFLKRAPNRNFVGAKCQMIADEQLSGLAFPRAPTTGSVFFINGIKFLTMEKFVHLSTFFMRRRLIDRWAEIFDQSVVSGDLTFLLTAALMDTDIAVLNSVVSHYRVHREGSWSKSNKTERYRNYAATWRKISENLSGIAEPRLYRIAGDNFAFYDTLSKRGVPERLSAAVSHGIQKIIRAGWNRTKRRINKN